MEVVFNQERSSMGNQRGADELRPIQIECSFLGIPGSVLFAAGNTKVLCAASLSDGVPPWRTGSGHGWLTAEYNMLPQSTRPRKERDRGGKVDGRTTEIQRLIGRSLRAAVDLAALGERTLTIDCDVLQADGGTRTAAITGGFIAIVEALRTVFPDITIGTPPLVNAIAAVSVGLIDGKPYLDLDYALDSRADVDMNVVMTGNREFIEVQGTGEGTSFTRFQNDQLLDLAQSGIHQLLTQQRQALGMPLDL
jgi:ribonuclease PH